MSRFVKSSCVALAAMAAMKGARGDNYNAHDQSNHTYDIDSGDQQYDSVSVGSHDNTVNVNSSNVKECDLSGHNNKVYVNVASVQILDMSQDQNVWDKDNGNHGNHIYFKPDTVATITKLLIGGSTNAVELQGDNITVDVLKKIDFQCTGDGNGVILPGNGVYDAVKDGVNWGNCKLYRDSDDWYWTNWYDHWWVWAAIGGAGLLLLAIIIGVVCGIVCCCCCKPSRRQNNKASTVHEPVIVSTGPRQPVCVNEVYLAPPSPMYSEPASPMYGATKGVH